MWRRQVHANVSIYYCSLVCWFGLQFANGTPLRHNSVKSDRHIFGFAVSQICLKASVEVNTNWDQDQTSTSPVMHDRLMLKCGTSKPQFFQLSVSGFFFFFLLWRRFKNAIFGSNTASSLSVCSHHSLVSRNVPPKTLSDWLHIASDSPALYTCLL